MAGLFHGGLPVEDLRMRCLRSVSRQAAPLHDSCGPQPPAVYQSSLWTRSARKRSTALNP